MENNLNGDLTFSTNGYQKNYYTNVDEAGLSNNLNYSSFPRNSSKIDGLQTNYKLLLRNLNSNTENSNNFNKLKNALKFSKEYSKFHHFQELDKILI